MLLEKKHLVRYTKHREENEFQKIVVTLDEPFLQKFMERHPQTATVTDNNESFFCLQENKLLKNYIQSLEAYYLGEPE